MERVRASLQSWKDAESQLGELQEKHSQAKKTRDERREAVLEAEDGDQSDKKVADLTRDWARADKKFTSIDRDMRSRRDLAKKMEAKVLENVEKLIEGDDEAGLFEGDEGEAWKAVLLADLVGDIHARGFVQQDAANVGAFLAKDKEDAWKPLVKSGELTRPQVTFMQSAVGKFLQASGRRRHATKGVAEALDKPRVSVPEQTETKGRPQIETDADGVVIDPPGQKNDDGK